MTSRAAAIALRPHGLAARGQLPSLGKICFSDGQTLNSPRLKQTHDLRIALLAATIFGFDQVTKVAVLNFLPVPYQSEIHVLPGFFRLVHWQNSGAAWSMFHDNNLVIVSAVALVVLVLVRAKFGSNTTLGSIALGLVFGGIAGNLLDRILHHHVIDFLFFHLITRSGVQHDFPAFNVADSAICVGVGLLFLLSWRTEKQQKQAEAPHGSMAGRGSENPTDAGKIN
jgi:signal peptidase II